MLKKLFGIRSLVDSTSWPITREHMESKKKKLSSLLLKFLKINKLQ